MASYLEIAAKDKLKLYEQQLYQNAGSDAILSRNLKNLKERDFKQQVQPSPAKVYLEAGRSSSISRANPWGRIGIGRTNLKAKAGGTVGRTLLAETKKDNWLAGTTGSGKNTTKINTGSTTLVEARKEWSTEGFLTTDVPNIDTQAKKIVKPGKLFGKVQAKIMDSNSLRPTNRVS